MNCLDCGEDISHRKSIGWGGVRNVKRCVPCSKARRLVENKEATARYIEKKKLSLICWCGKEFKGNGNKEYCSPKCIDGPEVREGKMYSCGICGSQTTNRLYCKDCRRDNADIESMVEYRR